MLHHTHTTKSYVLARTLKRRWKSDKNLVVRIETDEITLEGRVLDVRSIEPGGYLAPAYIAVTIGTTIILLGETSSVCIVRPKTYARRTFAELADLFNGKAIKVVKMPDFIDEIPTSGPRVDYLIVDIMLGEDGHVYCIVNNNIMRVVAGEMVWISEN